MVVVTISGAEDSTMSHTINDPEQIFHPIEHAIICEWLGVSPPEIAADIDIRAHLDGPEDGPITLASDYSGEPGYYAVQNAVARLVLSGIQKRLPQWAAFYEDHVVWGREYSKKTPRKVDFLPRFLFSINWANSGPGYSWPVAYNLAWLPIYDIYIVTESADSPDTFGYCDRALGWFGQDKSIEQGAKDVISLDWINQHLDGQQEHWEDFLDAGIISCASATEWADEVWKDADEEYEEDDEDDECEAEEAVQ